MPAAQGQPPPPPARRRRRPFVTSFVDSVLPFLPAKDLLACAGVCQIWREEANSLSLWRALLAANSATAIYTYSNFPLREIQKIVLQRTPLAAIGTTYVGHGFTSNTGDFIQNLENGAEARSTTFIHRQATNRVSERGFSSGLSFPRTVHNELGGPNLEITTTYADLKRRAESLMSEMGSLQSYMSLLKEQTSASTRALVYLSQHLPSSGAVLLHRECLREWKRLKLFEELVVNSLYLSIECPPPCRGVRSFAHAEMVGLGEVGSLFHLNWCRFKNVLPLNDIYFDYMNLLYSYGPGILYPIKLSLLEEAEGKRNLACFSRLRDIVNDVINRKYGESRNISWNFLLQCLEK
ncbi:hypothetical protein TraAM80_07908 [Trypanosoma rangeli]|uniref:F-box domain-containing protein n=1 Tax=Trypanosoma rangeli TaxID=5698 RepID=A0A3R7M5U2_TRYRA|nr:uncharacterized protein TraAM80_07908 [Trypanosoma rangeli]RNE99944.1 hypothetical protein TraAM80_07908 [Trypanosoma rangeli]|eukprot:RNE99944.1 hypothetical protein TraAM80_07908 [Trypanosoma rangeli]